MEAGHIAVLSLVALLTAALSAVAGLGGGTVLIGVFYLLGMPPEQAVPLFSAIQLVSNSARTWAYASAVEWRAAGWFLLAALPATFAVAPFVAGVDADWARVVLGALILLSLLPGSAQRAPLPPVPSYVAAGLLNGTIGLFIGATGLVVGRLFFRPDWAKETTIGTLAMTQTLGHGLRVLAFGVIGFSALAAPQLLVPLCAGVIAGTWLGKRLNAFVGPQLFARLFKGLLLVLSAKLLWDGLRGLLG